MTKTVLLVIKVGAFIRMGLPAVYHLYQARLGSVQCARQEWGSPKWAEIRFNGREPRVPGCPVNPGCTAGLTEHVLPNTVEPQWSHLKLHITDFAIRSGCFATRAGGGLERTFSKLSYL